MNGITQRPRGRLLRHDSGPTDLHNALLERVAIIPADSTNPANSTAFVNLILGPVGTAALNAAGPAPIVPATVSPADYARLPNSMQPFVRGGRIGS
jgi:hypothetical protein